MDHEVSTSRFAQISARFPMLVQFPGKAPDFVQLGPEVPSRLRPVDP